MTGAPLLIDAQNVGRTFEDGTTALSGASFAVPEKAFITLLGSSGCGKSTLLRLIAGLDEADDGSINWPAGLPGAGEIGFVFQEPTLMPWASVTDNIFLPFRLAGKSKSGAAGALDEIIRLVDLAGFEDSLPGQLSGGMKMRVSIARALVTKPRLLLMDEPFAALDEITRFRLNDDLLRIVDACGCTVLFVTHSVFEAAYLADEVLVMTPRPGRIAERVPVGYGAPRNAALRDTETYAATCGRIAGALRAAAS